MQSDKLKITPKAGSKAHLPVRYYAKLGPVLAILLLTLFAAAVFCFSALAAVPECWRQPPEPRLLELDGGSNAGPRQHFLQHNDLDGAGQLMLYPTDSAVPLASLSEWPLPDSMGPAAPFYAWPQPLDSNYDGMTDQLISTDFSGRIWQTDVTITGFANTLLLADLSHSDWRFIGSTGIIDVSLPVSLRPDGLPGRYKLLLLTARNINTGEDALVTLRLPWGDVDSSRAELAALIDRTALSAEEQQSGLSNEQWLMILNSAGWWVRLAGQLTQPPTVIGGVIYSAVATSDFSAVACASQSAEHSLLAMHLHSAGLVYNQRRFQLPTGEGQLKLLQQDDGSATLVLQTADKQQTLLTELQTISPACPDCTEPLQLDQFPRWLKLATYRQETGAH